MQIEAELDVSGSGVPQREGRHSLDRPPRKRTPHRLSITVSCNADLSSATPDGRMMLNTAGINPNRGCPSRF